MALSRRDVLPLIRRALAEDCAHQDITSRTLIPSSQRITVRVIAKSSGIAAGVNVAMLAFAALDPSLRCRQHVRSGERVRSGQPILTVTGSARSIFAAERVVLNFLMHLCGIATLTRAFVDRIRGTRAKIYDTRKTLPGLRALEKDAVRAGGGHSHRRDLAEAILIKTNHVRAHSTQHTAHSTLIGKLVMAAKHVKPRRFVEIEVTTLREFKAALSAHPHAILLDNMSLEQIRQAVSLRSHVSGLMSVQLEVSGGVTLANVRAIATTGVDRISIGRLTHSAPALDCSLHVTGRDISIFSARSRGRK